MTRTTTPKYWRTAIKHAWNTFSFHQGIGGVVIPALILFLGYLLGENSETIGRWTGVAGSVGVLLGWYLIVLLFVTPRQLWLEAQSKLSPSLLVTFDATNSLFSYPAHETYRLRVLNTGVASVADVRVRVVNAPTASYLRGMLPISLRRMHGGDPPFALNDNAPLFVDFLEWDCKSAQVTGFGRTFHSLVALICNDAASPQIPLWFDDRPHEIEIEVQGQNVPTSRKKLRIQSLLPNRSEAATLQIAEIDEFSPVANEPLLILRYCQDQWEDEETGETRPFEAFIVQNFGNAVATNVTFRPFQIGNKHFRQSVAIGAVSPLEQGSLAYIYGDLRRTLDNLRRQVGGGTEQGVAHFRLKLEVDYGWENKPDAHRPAEYVLTYKGATGIDVRHLAPDEQVEWTKFDDLFARAGSTVTGTNAYQPAG